jgi:hypothetical protein
LLIKRLHSVPSSFVGGIKPHAPNYRLLERYVAQQRQQREETTSALTKAV